MHLPHVSAFALAVLAIAPRPAHAQALGPALPDSGPPMPATGLTECVVDHITDGDTIVCRAQGRVRLIGIDAPEKDQQPFVTAATAGLAVLLPLAVTIQLSVDQTKRDRYNRLLAYAWLGHSSINWLMIRQGWAVSVRYPPDTLYAARFERAEALARKEQRGLWRVDGFACRPREHRAGSC